MARLAITPKPRIGATKSHLPSVCIATPRLLVLSKCSAARQTRRSTDIRIPFERYGECIQRITLGLTHISCPIIRSVSYSTPDATYRRAPILSGYYVRESQTISRRGRCMSDKVSIWQSKNSGVCRSYVICGDSKSTEFIASLRLYPSSRPLPSIILIPSYHIAVFISYITPLSIPSASVIPKQVLFLLSHQQLHSNPPIASRTLPELFHRRQSATPHHPPNRDIISFTTS
jgi:hypothetical protein